VYGVYDEIHTCVKTPGGPHTWVKTPGGVHTCAKTPGGAHTLAVEVHTDTVTGTSPFHHCIEVDSSFVLLLEVDVWRFFIEPDSVSLQFSFDDSLVFKWFEYVQNYKYETTGLCHSDNLPSSSSAVLGSFDDSW
jgi:hypothetical protein